MLIIFVANNKYKKWIKNNDDQRKRFLLFLLFFAQCLWINKIMMSNVQFRWPSCRRSRLLSERSLRRRFHRESTRDSQLPEFRRDQRSKIITHSADKRHLLTEHHWAGSGGSVRSEFRNPFFELNYISELFFEFHSNRNWVVYQKKKIKNFRKKKKYS